MSKFRVNLEASFILPDKKDSQHARDSILEMLQNHGLEEKNFEIGIESIGEKKTNPETVEALLEVTEKKKRGKPRKSPIIEVLEKPKVVKKKIVRKNLL